MKRILAVVMAALMLVLIVPVYATEAEVIPAKTRDNGIGYDLSAVHAPYLLQGGQLSTTDFFTIDDISSHTITVLNFWSQNCGYCLPEMPYFQYVHDNFPDVLVVGCGSTMISGSQTGEANYFFNNGYSYMSVFQDTVLYNFHYPNGYLPQTVILNSEGIVIDFIEGAMPSQQFLVDKVAQWLGYFSDEYFDVEFVNGVTGEVFETQSVHMGYKPTYPTPPEVTGYQFLNWSPSTPPVILGPTTITANYQIRTFRVRFYDNLTDPPTKLSTKYLQYGNSVEPPEAPEHEGYVFVGWDHDLSFVSEAMDVYTIYQPEGVVTPGDADGDGEVSTSDALLILRYALGLGSIPDYMISGCDIDGNGTVDSTDALMVLRMALNLA